PPMRLFSLTPGCSRSQERQQALAATAVTLFDLLVPQLPMGLTVAGAVATDTLSVVVLVDGEMSPVVAQLAVLGGHLDQLREPPRVRAHEIEVHDGSSGHAPITSSPRREGSSRRHCRQRWLSSRCRPDRRESRQAELRPTRPLVEGSARAPLRTALRTV